MTISKNGFKNNSKTITILSVVLLLCFLFILTDVLPFPINRKTSANAIFILISSLTFTSLFIIFIVSVFGTLKKEFGIYNFFIGDEGTYSLSRLQAVLWAVVIISYQISVIIALLLNSKANGLFYYEASFSESSVWLLGLSLSSYIAVKGITVEKIVKKPELKNSRRSNPEWCDILIGANGLDFARCQMLIWTLIALFAYLSKCYGFIYQLNIAESEGISKLFNHFYEDYSANTSRDSSFAFVPYLPWTFIVLMGMSQGAYIGKKLVPSFKIEEAEEASRLGINNNISNLDIEISAKQSILSNMKPTTEIGILNRKQLQLEIQELLTQRDKQQAALNKLQV